MGFFQSLFGRRPYPADRKEEVERMIADLVRIGKVDDFLSERPGGPFNAQCRHVRAREIGSRLNEIGNTELMEFAHRQVKKSLGENLATHLSYAWTDIGKWVP